MNIKRYFKTYKTLNVYIKLKLWNDCRDGEAGGWGVKLGNDCRVVGLVEGVGTSPCVLGISPCGLVGQNSTYPLCVSSEATNQGI